MSHRPGGKPPVISWRTALPPRCSPVPGFQRWATRFPLTRPVARRRARALFDLTAGFVYSQILAACVQLDLFEALRARPAHRRPISPPCSICHCPADRAFAARRRGAGPARGDPRRRPIALGSLGAAPAGQPRRARGLIAHHALLYRDLADPVGLLRGQHAPGGLAAYWPYASSEAPAALGAEQVERLFRADGGEQRHDRRPGARRL